MALAAGINSYVTVEVADAYHGERANAEWPCGNQAEDIALKEAALIKATAFIDGIGRGKWKGVKTSPEQPLAWPRVGVKDEEGFPVDSESIPCLVAQAVFEAALRVITGVDLAPDMERGGAIKQEVFGPISTTYMDNAPAETRFPVIENLLSGFVARPLFDTAKSVSGTVRIVRS